MDKKQLSPEGQKAKNAVAQMEQLIGGLVDTAKEIQDILFFALNFNAPKRWPEIIEEAQSALCPIHTEMKRICHELEKLYTNNPKNK